jgi:hypothetical protein
VATVKTKESVLESPLLLAVATAVLAVLQTTTHHREDKLRTACSTDHLNLAQEDAAQTATHRSAVEPQNLLLLEPSRSTVKSLLAAAALVTVLTITVVALGEVSGLTLELSKEQALSLLTVETCHRTFHGV